MEKTLIAQLNNMRAQAQRCVRRESENCLLLEPKWFPSRTNQQQDGWFFAFRQIAAQLRWYLPRGKR